MEAHAQGYEAYLIFVVQMKGISHVEPNWKTQPAFGEALKKARQAGVHLLAYDCLVEKDSLEVNEQVPVVLDSLDLIAQPLLAWYDAHYGFQFLFYGFPDAGIQNIPVIEPQSGQNPQCHSG